MTQQTWIPNARGRPVVVVGGSQFVKDQVARCCAAAGISPVFVPSLAEAPSLDPAVLIVGHEHVAGGMPGQKGVIVVGTTDDESRVWSAAAALPSSRVVILPQGAGWLAEHLGRRLNPAASGSVIGFLGAAGGCGASTLAFWCARHAAQGGRPALLVDGHPTAGGLDLALGLEDRPGVRWHDLQETRGSLSAERLASALPAEGRLSVLSHAARPDSAGAVVGGGMGSAAVVLDAARGAFDSTFVDLGSSGVAVPSLASACDRLVLLVPSRPRSVAAVPALLAAFAALPVTVVLRGRVLDGLDPWVVADLLGRAGPLPYVPFVRGVSTAEAGGGMLGFSLSRRVRRVVASLVTDAARPR